MAAEMKNRSGKVLSDVRFLLKLQAITTMKKNDPSEKYRSLIYKSTGRKVTIHQLIPVGGGSINQCLKAETDIGFFFIKENDPKKFPGMFEAEAHGLKLLAETGTFVVPSVLGITEEENRSLLLLQWLEKKNPDALSWYEAGEKLAALHRQTHSVFGLEISNYIGSLPQQNTFHNSWEDFFTLERILPQIKLARDGGRIDSSLVGKAEKFCAKCGSIFPPEKPALLHGDLWSGNFFISVNGPALFDPAVYFGHREMDLAMTQLFGGFDPDFYVGYRNAFAPEQDWQKRIPYCNLYPLLVHLNLFGAGYLYDVKSTLAAF